MAPMNSTGPVQIGDDAQAGPMTRDDAIDAIVAKRADQWKQAIDAELQELITQAASIRQNISTARTQTKRKYYEKKFVKISVQVRQMIAALQRVQSTAVNNNAPTSATESN